MLCHLVMNKYLNILKCVHALFCFILYTLNIHLSFMSYDSQVPYFITRQG